MRQFIAHRPRLTRDRSAQARSFRAGLAHQAPVKQEPTEARSKRAVGLPVLQGREAVKGLIKFATAVTFVAVGFETAATLVGWL